jgi:hypothetical protein
LRLKPLEEFITGISRSQNAIEKAINSFDVAKVRKMINKNRKNKGKDGRFKVELNSNEKNMRNSTNLDQNLLEELHEVIECIIS